MSSIASPFLRFAQTDTPPPPVAEGKSAADAGAFPNLFAGLLEGDTQAEAHDAASWQSAVHSKVAAEDTPALGIDGKEGGTPGALAEASNAIFPSLVLPASVSTPAVEMPHEGREAQLSQAGTAAGKIQGASPKTLLAAESAPSEIIEERSSETTWAMDAHLRADFIASRSAGNRPTLSTPVPATVINGTPATAEADMPRTRGGSRPDQAEGSVFQAPGEPQPALRTLDIAEAIPADRQPEGAAVDMPPMPGETQFALVPPGSPAEIPAESKSSEPGQPRTISPRRAERTVAAPEVRTARAEAVNQESQAFSPAAAETSGESPRAAAGELPPESQAAPVGVPNAASSVMPPIAGGAALDAPSNGPAPMPAGIAREPVQEAPKLAQEPQQPAAPGRPARLRAPDAPRQAKAPWAQLPRVAEKSGAPVAQKASLLFSDSQAGADAAPAPHPSPETAPALFRALPQIPPQTADAARTPQAPGASGAATTTSAAEFATAAAPSPLPFPVPRESGMTDTPQPARKTNGNRVAQVLALSGQVPRNLESIAPVEAAPPPVTCRKGAEAEASVAQPLWPGTAQEAPATAPSPNAAPVASRADQPQADQPRAEAGLPGDPQVRTLNAATADRDEVAFILQARPESLKQVPARNNNPAAPGFAQDAAIHAPGGEPPIGPRVVADGEPRGTQIEPARPVGRDQSVRTASPALESATITPAAPGDSQAQEDRLPGPVPAAESERPAEREDRERRPAVAAERTPVEQASIADAPAVPKFHPQTVAAGPARPDAPARTESGEPKPAVAHEAADREVRAETPKATAVRDVKLEVTGGDRRVEVRLTERGGEVKMTVRTPDAPLAGTLRENLPALHARLAESGLKSQAWHPASAQTSESRSPSEAAQPGNSQDQSGQHRQPDRDAQEGDPRRQRNPQENVAPKQKGKDFAWFMSTLG
ncbi:MAG: hypothetical protein ABI759_04260 [Candidatus Solibacter sp.]